MNTNPSQVRDAFYYFFIIIIFGFVFNQMKDYLNASQSQAFLALQQSCNLPDTDSGVQRDG